MCAVSVVCTAREVRRARRRRRAWPVRLGVCASTVRAGRCGGCWGTVVRPCVRPWLSEGGYKSARKRKSLLPLVAPVRCCPSLWRLCRCPSGTGLSTAIMPAPPVVAPTIVALDDLHQELSAVSADVREDANSHSAPGPWLHSETLHGRTQ